MKRPIRLGLLLGAAAILTWMSVEMGIRTANQELWAYRPLFFFIALWTLIVLLTGPRASRPAHKQRWRRLGLASLSGLLLGLGFPGLLPPFPLLMLVGFLPLLLVEQEIAAEREKPSPWEVAKFSYAAFVPWNILSTFWVANSALAAGAFAIFVNSALMCLPMVLFHLTRKVLPRLGYASWIAYWLAFEYGHLNWELSWPWLTLGNGFSPWPAFIQWYEYTGALGGSLWILLLNVFFLQVWNKRQAPAERRRPVFLAAAAVLLPVALSLLLFFSYRETGKTIDVLVVQPNFEPHYEKPQVPDDRQAERFLSLLSPQMDSAVDYVVFPESSFGFVNAELVKSYPALLPILQLLEQYPQARLVSGVDAFHLLAPGEPHTGATRRQINARGDTLYFEAFNAAAQIASGSEPVEWYRKSKLVPGPEIFPYRRYLGFLRPLVQQFQGTWEGVATQPERGVFKGPEAAVGPVICYESVFGEFMTGYARRGAQAIFIVTNDGWWDQTPGHRQHLYFASMRAIEQRRSIARAANTGISGFIDQRGLIRETTRYNEPAVRRAELRLNDRPTFYLRWGDLCGRLSLFMALILAVNTLVRRITAT